MQVDLYSFHVMFQILEYLFKLCLNPIAYASCYFVTGPTSFAPIIEMAMTIVEQSGGQYHVLLIIANGQVFCLVFSFSPISS